MVNNSRHRNRLAKLPGRAEPVKETTRGKKHLHLLSNFSFVIRRAEVTRAKVRYIAYKAYLEATRDPRGEMFYKPVGPYRVTIKPTWCSQAYRWTYTYSTAGLSTI